MGNVDTGSSSTVSNSPQVKSAINNIAGQLGGMAKPGATSYVAPSANTTQGWQASLNAAGNPAYSQGLAGAMSSFGNRAAGNELGMQDPGYATMRAKLENDVMRSTNTAFNQSGLFGSDSNQKAAASGLADSLGALDYRQYGDSLDRQTSAAAMMPQLFQGSQLPASIQQAVGSAQDQNNQAQQMGELDWLSSLTGAISGAGSAAGSRTTESMPMWKAILGTVATAAGSAAKGYGGKP